MTTAALTDRAPAADPFPPPAGTTARPRLGWIDCTRGVAIVAVLIYHGLGALGIPNQLNGQTGVDAFVLLSGFGLAYALRDEPWYAFVWRRLLRLMPAYWIVLALCVWFLTWRGFEVPTRQVVLNATCLHLLAGGSHGMAINMSFWFMGLIVPLYVWFAVIRWWLLGDARYWVLGGSIAAAWAVGAVVTAYPEAPTAIVAPLGKVPASWGTVRAAADAVVASVEAPWDSGHIPHRVPLFFVGAVFGLMFRRREAPDRLLAEPAVMLGFALLIPVSVACRWVHFPIALATGLGIVAVGAYFAGLGDRWRVCRPPVILLTGLGAVSYELYLCHQFILIDVNAALLSPRLAQWLPGLSDRGRGVVGLCGSYAAAVWAAYLLRWVVAPLESLRTWRPTVVALVLATAVLAVIAVAAPRGLGRMKPREIRVTVVVAPSALPAAEPILQFGSAGAADMVVLEHDGAGRARLMVDHWGHAPAYSDWVPAAALSGDPWTIRISEDHLVVRAGALEVRSVAAPYQPTAKVAVGRNDIGFSTTPRQATSRVERVRP
ncbi:MAG TPA: acyltransferase [Humisphaera sp.]